MTGFKGMLLAGLVLTGTLVGACSQDGSALATAALRQADATASDPGSAAPAGRRAAHPGVGRGHGLMGLMAGVSLSDDQKAQIKAILEAHRPAGRPAHDLHTLLTADTIDAAAIRAAFAQAETDRAQRDRDHLAILGEIRAVTTEAQRADIVARLPAAPDPGAGGRDVAADRAAKRAERDAARAARLGLTDEQQAAVAALRPATATRPDPAAHRAAMITFWQTGDTSALQALPKRPAPDVEAVVTAATLLTADQRQAVFGRMAGHGGGRRGHGPHGPGFGGPEGPGGPRPEAPTDQPEGETAV